MFEKVIGHDEQKEILSNDISQGRVSHAYAFVGPNGIGKKMLAREFAKKLLKVDDLDVAIDYKQISKVEGKKNILIEQIRRDIVDDVYIAPAAGDYKVYVVDDADFLNEESQNALLKTLEEPPSYVCIILVTENLQKFLPTIVSRVKQVTFSKLSDNDVEKYCNINNLDILLDNEMKLYIDGSIGKLTSLNDKDNYELFKLTEKLVETLKQKEELNSIKMLENVNLKTTNVLEYLEYLLYYNNLYKYVFEIERAKTKLQYNGNEDIIKTVMAVNICRKEK